MILNFSATLLGVAVAFATASPTNEEWSRPADGVVIGSPRMIPPKYRSTATRAIIRYPAFTLAARGQGGGISLDASGQSGLMQIGQGMCSRCTLLSAHYRLVHPDGQEATPKDGVYIHHIISFLRPKTSSSPIQDRMFGFGSALGGFGAAYFIDRGEDSGQSDTIFTSPDGKYDSGYHIKSSPSITLSYDLVNYKNEPRQLHIELEYEYVDGIVGQDAGHTLKTVAGSPNLNGKSTSFPMKVTKPSTIMWARGHLHSGGDSMVLKINGETKCISKPTYDEKGVITEMSICPDRIPIKTGDTMTIESFYDTAKHKLRESSDGSGHAAHGRFGNSDVMGMFAMSYTT